MVMHGHRGAAVSTNLERGRRNTTGETGVDTQIAMQCMRRDIDLEERRKAMRNFKAYTIGTYTIIFLVFVFLARFLWVNFGHRDWSSAPWILSVVLAVLGSTAVVVCLCYSYSKMDEDFREKFGELEQMIHLREKALKKLERLQSTQTLKETSSKIDLSKAAVAGQVMGVKKESLMAMDMEVIDLEADDDDLSAIQRGRILKNIAVEQDSRQKEELMFADEMFPDPDSAMRNVKPTRHSTY